MYNYPSRKPSDAVNMRLSSLGSRDQIVLMIVHKPCLETVLLFF